VTTNQQTFVRFDGKEIEVGRDDGQCNAVDRKKLRRAVKFLTSEDDEIIVGHQGIAHCSGATTSHTDLFQFINTTVDADEPKSAVIRELARELQRRKAKIKSRSSADLQSCGRAPASTWCASSGGLCRSALRRKCICRL
jgi:hypothetical protein